MNSFEGSFLGRHDRIDAGTRLECGVCWYVYDPQAGDPVWQIPAGTAFSDLPDHWRCPLCDAAQEQFMVLSTGQAPRTEDTAHSVHGRLAAHREQLIDAYRQVQARMRDLPVYRDDLPLGLIGPRRAPAGLAAVLYTPWCMNILLLSEDAERLVEGSEREISLPSGNYRFVRGFLPGVGPMESCSLFSPMDDFTEGSAVEAVAAEVMQALLTSPESGHGEQELENPGRRRFLGGSRSAQAKSGPP